MTPQASGRYLADQENQLGSPRVVNKGKESLVISKKVVALCAAFGVALTGASIAVPATAEPVANTFAIVGSDTLEDAVNGLVNGAVGSSVRTFAKNSTMGSFDATGSPCIVTKAFGARFGRPNGSSDGVKALSRSIDGGNYTSGTTTCPDNTSRVITGYVDIARSSSAGTVNAAGELLYIPFGRDAFAYAYHSASDAAGITTLTKAQLEGFFECTVRTLDGKTITPVIPQDGSGTRKDFIAKINVTEATLLTVAEGGCVVEGQEHDGRSLTVANAIMPMSASRWVAMTTGMTASKIGSAVLAGIADVGTSPVTGTGADMVPNSAYYADSTFGRDTYLVVEYARVNPTDPKYDPDLAAALDPTISDSLANTSTTLSSKSGYWKKKFGFLAPASSTTFRVAKTA
jgi:ABC-type phosphate transport system substrate-binding protein